jgi:hypothetical protein
VALFCFEIRHSSGFSCIRIRSRQQSFSTRIFFRAWTSTYVFVEQGLDPLFPLHLGYSRLVRDLEQTWCDLCQPLRVEMVFSFVSRVLCFGGTTYLGLDSSDIVHVLLGRQNERIIDTAEAKQTRRVSIERATGSSRLEACTYHPDHYRSKQDSSRSQHCVPVFCRERFTHTRAAAGKATSWDACRLGYPRQASCNPHSDLSWPRYGRIPMESVETSVSEQNGWTDDDILM